MTSRSTEIIGKILLDGEIKYFRILQFILKYSLSVVQSLSIAASGEYCIGFQGPCKNYNNKYIQDTIGNVVCHIDKVLNCIHKVIVEYTYNNLTEDTLYKFDDEWQELESSLKEFKGISGGAFMGIDETNTVEDMYVVNLEYMIYGAFRSILLYLVSDRTKFLINHSYYYNKIFIQLIDDIVEAFSWINIPHEDYGHLRYELYS